MMGGMGDAAAIASALAKVNGGATPSREGARAAAAASADTDAACGREAYPSGSGTRAASPARYDCVPPGARGR